MMISLSCVGVSAADTSIEEPITLDNYKEKIVEAVKKSENITTDKVSVISDNNNTHSVNPDMAIRVEKEKGTEIIIPNVVVDGELVNSFSYIKGKLLTRSQPVEVTDLSDVALHFYCEYEKQYMGGLLAFRPFSMSFYWTSKRYNPELLRIRAQFETYGEYWNTNTQTSLGYNKDCICSLDKTDPNVNQTYYAYSDTSIPSAYGIVCTRYPEHGGILYYEYYRGGRLINSCNFLLFDKGGEHSPY